MKTVDFKRIIRYFKLHKGEVKERSVLRDWKMILIGFVVILVVNLLINGFIFLKYKNEIFSEISAGEGRAIKIDKVFLQNILDEIDKKEKRYNESLTLPQIKDPS